MNFINSGVTAVTIQVGLTWYVAASKKLDLWTSELLIDLPFVR
jgi:hypothetical protein